jgi:ATP-binding cassette, subfamily B, bacterial
MRNIDVIGRLVSYIKPYTGRLILLIVLSLVGVIFMVAKPLPVKFIIDNVLLKKELPDALHGLLPTLGTSAGTNDMLIWCLAFMAITVIGGIVVSYLSFLLMHKLGLNLIYDLSLDLYRKFQSLSISFYTKNKTGDLLQRFNGDIFVVYLMVVQILLPVITSLLALAGMFYIMFIIDPVLAFIAISVVPVLIVLLFALSKPMNNTTMDQYYKQGELSAFVQQSLVSMRVIQAFVREGYMLKRLVSRALGFKKAYYKANMISEGYNQSTNLITGIASVVLVGIGASKGIAGKISPGDLYVFLGYIAALYGPVNSLTTAAGAIITIGARGKRIFEIMDSEDEIRDVKHAVDLTNVHGTVKFNHVDFGYNRNTAGENLVLRNISLEAPAGQVIAIVGPTGAGKTSLISLLGRFHEPWHGSITIDGKNIKDYSVNSLRRNISIVLQDPILFPESVAENIAFGNPEASMDQIMEAARLSEAHDFIMNLPAKYETVVSEAGLSLSGGEKQRLTLARAFLVQTPIIILDEPTSSVDALTEVRIFERLKSHNLNKTVFVISHRLSTIKNADRIYVLEHGEITESGTHKELIMNEKLYFSMYTHQTID